MSDAQVTVLAGLKALALAATCLGAIGCARPGETTPSPSPDHATTARQPSPSGRELFDRKRTCTDLGIRRDERSVRGNPPDVFVLPSKYCYSEQLNTCLYEGGLISWKREYAEYVVVDLLTNEGLVGENTRGKGFNRAPEAFQRRRDEIFATCTK